MKTILPKLMLCVALVIACNFSHAATYYFSTGSGDDSRSASQAQNPSTPWKTIHKLNQIFSSLKPGDAVLFKRGETFYGSISIQNSGSSGNPIVIGSYGSGSKPIITSLVTLKEWKSIGNGIYESSHSSLGNEVNIVLLNDMVQEMGRYPNSDAQNKGYLTLETASGNSSISDKELSSAPNFTGGEVVIRKNQHIIDRHQITSHSGNRLSYNGSGPYSPKDGYGYFIQNHMRTLDREGEWFFNASSKKMNIYFGSNSPSSYSIQANSFDNLITNSYGTSHIVIENLHLKGSGKDAILLEGGKEISIRDCDIEFSGINGITAVSISELLVEKCKVLDSNNNGIYLRYGNNNSIVRNNRVENTFVKPGTAQNGDQNGIGIFVNHSDNNLVEYNEIIKTGFNGITFGGNSTIIKNNLIDTFCSLKSDGGGVYSYTGKDNTTFSGRKITGNIILNGLTSHEGTVYTGTSYTPLVQGIFLDDNTSGVEIRENTIGNITDSGIKLQNARNIIVKSNTVYNANTQIFLNNSKTGGSITNTAVTDNILFSKLANQWTMGFRSINDDIIQPNLIDKNQHIRPLGDKFSISTDNSGKNESFIFDLEGWQNKFKKEVSSTPDRIQIKSYKIEKEIGSNMIPNGNFDKNDDGAGCTTDCNDSWTGKGSLDGGSMKVVTTGKASAVKINVGSVSNTKNYILKFSALANRNGAIRVVLRHSNAPWQEISSHTTHKVSNKREEYETVFSFPKSASESAIMIYSQDQDLTYWLDNLELVEAEVTFPDPDELILFEYNPSSTSKTISLSGDYMDAKKTVYSGEVTLNPYSSIVLVKTSPIEANPTKDNNKSFSSIFLNTGSSSDSDYYGNRFLGDNNFSSYYKSSDTFTETKASSTEIYQTERNSHTLNYAIPLPNGIYTVRTYHNELWYGRSGPAARAGRRVFDITIEGDVVKEKFDLFVENSNRPTELTFREIEVKDGMLNIDMIASEDRASISGIAILSLSDSENINEDIRFFNAGDSETTFYQENYHLGEKHYRDLIILSEKYINRTASKDPLFQTERYAENLNYAIPLPNGTYTVQTFHNELFFGLLGPSASKGRRVFDISIEGQKVKDHFDLFVESGNKPTILTFENVIVKDGVLNLDMNASANNATVSGIAIIDVANKNKLASKNLRIYAGSENSEENKQPTASLQQNTKLYPNPAKNTTTLFINHEIPLDRILIYNMNGQLIQDLDPSHQGEGHGKFTIPLNNMKAGVYLVSLVGKKEMIEQLRLIVRP